MATRNCTWTDSRKFTFTFLWAGSKSFNEVALIDLNKIWNSPIKKTAPTNRGRDFKLTVQTRDLNQFPRGHGPVAINVFVPAFFASRQLDSRSTPTIFVITIFLHLAAIFRVGSMLTKPKQLRVLSFLQVCEFLYQTATSRSLLTTVRIKWWWW